jgi:hypothetical protein
VDLFQRSQRKSVEGTTNEGTLAIESAGKSTTVARNLGLVGPGLSASRDGRIVVFARVDSSVDELMLVEGFR